MLGPPNPNGFYFSEPPPNPCDTLKLELTKFYFGPILVQHILLLKNYYGYLLVQQKSQPDL